MILIWIILSILLIILILRLPSLNKNIAEMMDLKLFEKRFKSNILDLFITNFCIVFMFYYINSIGSEFDLLRLVQILCGVVVGNLLLLANFYYICFINRKKETNNIKKSVLEMSITLLITISLTIAINIYMILKENKILNIFLVDIFAMTIISVYIIKKIISLKKCNQIDR